MRDDGAQMYTGLDQRTLNKRTSDRGSIKSPRSVLSKSLSGGSMASIGSSRQLNGGAAGTPRDSEYGCASVLVERLCEHARVACLVSRLQHRAIACTTHS